MRPLVIIDTSDMTFAETLGRTLSQLGFLPRLHEDNTGTEQPERQDGDVVLLDIRHLAGEAFGLLNSIKQRHPGIEVVLINKPDNIGASIAGMKAGAVDEIIVPFDTGSLKKKIAEACKRRKAARTKNNKKSLFARFSDTMAAAAFAQAGSYDDALDFLDGTASRQKKANTTKEK